jgi:hypothetical protein
VVGTEVVTLSGGTVPVFGGVNAGNYSVTVTGLTLGGAGAGNYQLAAGSVTDSVVTITPKSLTLSGLNLTDRVYNATTAATTVASYGSLTGVIAGDVGNVTAATGTVAAFSSKNAGAYSVDVTGLTLTGTKAANYALSSTTATDSSVTISKAALTVTGATSVNKTYDGTTALAAGATAFTASGVIAGDTLTYTGAPV